MATEFFDTPFDPILQGEINRVEVYDKDSNKNKVLEKDEKFDVEVEWHVFGAGASTIAGEWNVQLMLESMGEGFEGKIADTKIPYTSAGLTSTPIDRIWTHKFVDLDPSNFFPATEPNGVYKLVVLITYENPLLIPDAMAGSYEGPLLTFYQP